jgi:hypothetical protein
MNLLSIVQQPKNWQKSSLKDATILCYKFISITFLVAAERSEAALG